MADNQGETTKKQRQQHTPSPEDPPHEEQAEAHHHLQHQPSPTSAVTTGAPFISPLYVPTSSHFENLTPKRPRYDITQWKLIASPSSQPQTTVPASSSDTASSPSGQESDRPPAADQTHHQLRKGKYVSPVWKPNEMLWLAKAWRVQYESGSNGSAGASKTRADKDREVAEFLNRHGVNRDAKTAGTKWDNMLGEFRKVYEWERGGGSGEGEQAAMGKSYFRLSPYERKLHRLPASFDEDVFEELTQFMGSRMRASQGRRGTSLVIGDDPKATSLSGVKALPPPPPPPPSFKVVEPSHPGMR